MVSNFALSYFSFATISYCIEKNTTKYRMTHMKSFDLKLVVNYTRRICILSYYHDQSIYVMKMIFAHFFRLTRPIIIIYMQILCTYRTVQLVVKLHILLFFTYTITKFLIIITGTVLSLVTAHKILSSEQTLFYYILLVSSLPTFPNK